MKKIYLPRPQIIIAVIVTLLTPVLSTLSAAPDLYIDRTTITSAPASYYLYNSPAYSFSVMFRYPLTSIYSKGLLLDSFSMASPLISYTAEIQQNSPTNATLTFNPFGSDSKIASISFSILIVMSGNDYFQLLSLEFTSANCSWFNVSSAKFTFIPTSDFQINSLIQWINFGVVLNLIGTSQKFLLSKQLYSSTSQIGLLACSFNPSYVSRFKVNVVIINPKKHTPNINIVNSAASVSNTTLTYTFLTTDYGQPLADHNCFFGTNVVYYDVQPTLQFTITSSSPTTGTFSSTISQFKERTICLVLCPSSTFFNDSASTCDSCNNSILNCLSCSSYVNCTQCFDSYVFSTLTNTCVLCNSLMPNCIGCSSNTNCSECADFYGLEETSRICVLCNSTMSNCLKCNSSTNCQICAGGYGLEQRTGLCLSCSSALIHCVSCNGSNTCAECRVGFSFLPSAGTCFQCSSTMEYCQACSSTSDCIECAIGKPVVGGCTTITGCLEVNNLYTPSGPSSFCTQCDQNQYTFESVNNTCICKAGFTAGVYCTQIAGCMSTAKINGKTQCIYCDIQNHFYYNTTIKKCLCRDGFQLQGYNCSDICGDGRVFTSDCDDGNLIDGDGCSSSCTIEIKYKCSTNSSLTPSVCQYIGKNIQITLVDTQRSDDFDNRGIFTFAFSPAMPSISKMNLSNYFYFSCYSAVYEVVDWRYQNGKAILQVDYQTDLEEQLASVNFTFNHLLIISEPIIVDFIIKSDGIALTYGIFSLNLAQFGYFFLGIAILAIVILMVGSWVQEMVGVQLINALQIVYYLHYTAHSYTSASKLFQNLSIVGLDLLFAKKNQINVQFADTYQKIIFSINDAEKTLLILSFICGFLVIIKILSTVFSTCSEDHGKQKIQRLIQKFNISFALPLSLVLIIPIFLVASNFWYLPENNWSLPLQIISALILFVQIVISFIFAKNFVQLFIQHPKKQQTQPLLSINPYYIPVFQLYVFSELILIWLWLKTGVESCSYLMIALCLLMMSWQIVISPYALTFDNVSIFLNICFSLIFQLFMVVKNKLTFNLGVEIELFLYLSFGCLFVVCELISIIRIIRAIRLNCKTSEKQEKIKELEQKLKGKNQAQNEQKKKELFAEYKPKTQQHFIRYLQGKAIKNARKSVKTQIDEAETLKLLKKKMKKDLKQKKDKKYKETMEENQKLLKQDLRTAVLKL